VELHPLARRHLEDSSDGVSLPVPLRSWREQEVKSIMTGQDERSKHLLCQFCPFHEIFAVSIGAPVPQTTVAKINWHAFLPVQVSNDPVITADAMSTESWKLFQQVPFRSWVQSSLNLEDTAVGSFKLCHERLKLHVCHYLRTHVDRLPWFLRVTEVRRYIP
jgi:hypothetical protein